MTLFPKEHGAYGQLAFPLLTSYAVAGVSTPAVLIGLAALAGFLAHESLLVLLGRRGPRARRDVGRRAMAWLAVSAATMTGSGIGVLWLVSPVTRWSLLVPLLPAAFLVAALAAGREKSAEGEIAAALAFSLLAVPVCLAAGAATTTALSVGIAFASILVTGTLSVRAIVLRARGGGNPSAARATRFVVLALATAAAAGLVVAGARALLPWTTLFAAAPGLLTAGALAARAPSPTKLRTVGWTLVGAASAGALILVAGSGA